jgi:hypothetical protein
MALGGALQKLKREVMRGINREAYFKTRLAALKIVNDLQTLGPYWDGYFYNAWEVREGDVTIPADQIGGKNRREAEAHPKRGAFVLGDIPNQRVDYRSVPSLTIGNRMEYRDVAMDLEPGRIKGGGNETAPQDWYVTYYAGGGLDKAVSSAIKENINLPAD